MTNNQWPPESWHRRMWQVELTILGQPISWKRGRQIAINRKTGKTFVAVTAPHKRWMREAVKQLKGQWQGLTAIPKDVEVNLCIVSYLATRRLIDASNLYQGPEDAMQEAGVLENDCCVRSHNGSDRRYDKDNPRVEIRITPIKENKDA